MSLCCVSNYTMSCLKAARISMSLYKLHIQFSKLDSKLVFGNWLIKYRPKVFLVKLYYKSLRFPLEWPVYKVGDSRRAVNSSMVTSI